MAYDKSFFEDETLKTPEHDKILLWSLNNYKKILDKFNLIKIPIIEQSIRIDYKYQELGKWDSEKGEFILKENLGEYGKRDGLQFQSNIKESLIRYNDYKNKDKNIFNKTIEYSIKNRDWVNGFIDLKIDHILKLYDDYIFRESLKNNKDFSNHYTEDQFLYYYNSYFLEIKPEIKSIGETIRQINYYRTFLNGTFILVTKTKGLKELFLSQNIYVYEYDEKEVLKEGDGNTINQ